MDMTREQLKEKYKEFMPNWLNYDFFNFDEEYSNIYKIICKEIGRHSKGDIANNVCSTYFGFIENTNRKEENIYKNHDMWTEFIQWPYNTQNEHPYFVHDNMNTFSTNLGTLIREKMDNIINNVETLNEKSESLKNVLKLFYFSDGISDVISVLRGDNQDNKLQYQSYCKFVNDCLDMYGEYNPIICINVHEESKSHNICNVLETFFVKYRDMLYPVVRTRGNVTSQNDPLYDRIRCSVSDIAGEKYTVSNFYKSVIEDGFSPFNITMTVSFSILGLLLVFFLIYKLTPLGKMIDARVQRRKIRKSGAKMRRTDEKKSSKGEYTDSDYSKESH
ncbi:PIR Superfamily Protein [Plasmodium ovale wallikeri]|uniref:PIR Superfamily Protein n=1 Tax=Plasmodium ovale wallikeri TaxID=864142 RepID=A0A1A9AQ30_PLAOA|nr:PIR Superfamily Protein [Plasmodium ovale wallikeri]SBT58735.1 PIR Superfamily Protein [Plasmodium ovale wallikeri]